jgi:hypothetical protein
MGHTSSFAGGSPSQSARAPPADRTAANKTAKDKLDIFITTSPPFSFCFSFLLVDYIQIQVFATKIYAWRKKKAAASHEILFLLHLACPYAILCKDAGFSRVSVHRWMRTVVSLLSKKCWYALMYDPYRPDEVGEPLVYVQRVTPLKDQRESFLLMIYELPAPLLYASG